MSITDIQAEDEIFGIINTAWTAGLSAVTLPYIPKIYFPDKIVPVPPVDEIFAECNLAIVIANQASLARYQGKSTYETVGLAAIQIYSPKQSASALRTAKIIGGAIKDAFCAPSPSGEIWFRGQRLTPVAGNSTRNQVNVVVTCTYKTIK